MTVVQAIAEAERLLPGVRAAAGEVDPRWQAIIAVGGFIGTHPDAVWRFALRWGGHIDEDLRDAIATCLLEDLLEEHFDQFFPLLEAAVRSDRLFADTFRRCWKLGRAKRPDRAAQFDRLQNDCAKFAV